MAVTLRFQSTGSIPGAGHPVQMRGNSLTIGRADENDLVLPDPDKTLSKRHCVIEDHNGNVVVVDISSNGTFLNYGKIALGATPTPINNGDILTIGPYEVLVDITSAQDAGNIIPDPLMEGPVSHGMAASAPTASELLDAPGDGGDFLDDLLSGRDGPVGHRGVDRDEPDEDGLLPPLGPDDPILPPAGLDDYTGPAQSNHNPSSSDHFTGSNVQSGGGVIPDDWDDDFFAPDPSAAPAARDPLAADPLAADPLGADPLAADPLAPDPLAPSPAGQDPLALRPGEPDPLAGDPLGADPLASDPLSMPQPAAPDPLTAQPAAAPAQVPPGADPLAPANLAAEDPLSPPRPGSAGDPFGEEGDSRPPIAGSGQEQVEDEYDIVPDTLDDVDLSDYPEPGEDTAPPPGDDPLGDILAGGDAGSETAPPPAQAAPPEQPQGRSFSATADDTNTDTVVPSTAAMPGDPTEVPQAPAAAPSPQPPAAAPVPAPAAVGAAVAASGPDAATLAFLKALGADDVRIEPSDTVPTMSRLGHVLRIMIEGIREILMTRTSIKSEFRIEQTRISAGGNNPLKFSISPEQAIEAMVKTKAKGYLDAADAADQALKDIKAHEVAMVSGMEAALKGVLAKLDPAELESKIEAGGGFGSMLKSKKARYWEVYEKMYAEISDQAENEFHDLFAKEFARAYQEQLEKLK